MPGITIADLTEDGRFLGFDLYDLLRAIGNQALESEWECYGVDCIGQSAEKLFAYSDQNIRVNGKSLLKIAEQVQQTFEGNFRAFRQQEEKPWLVIQAVDGTCFDVESLDSTVIDVLRQQFSQVSDFPPDVGSYL